MTSLQAPVIDLSNFEQRKLDIRQQLSDAATGVGFFYITGHGIPEQLVSEAWKISERFFQQPESAKQALPKVDWANVELMGFERIDLQDGTIHESMVTSYETQARMKSAWPREDLVPGFRTITQKMMAAMEPVVQQLLSCFAEALGHPSDFFVQVYADQHKEMHLDGLSKDPKQGLALDDINVHVPHNNIYVYETRIWCNTGKAAL